MLASIYAPFHPTPGPSEFHPPTLSDLWGRQGQSLSPPHVQRMGKVTFLKPLRNKLPEPEQVGAMPDTFGKGDSVENRHIRISQGP